MRVTVLGCSNDLCVCHWLCIAFSSPLHIVIILLYTQPRAHNFGTLTAGDVACAIGVEIHEITSLIIKWRAHMCFWKSRDAFSTSIGVDRSVPQYRRGVVLVAGTLLIGRKGSGYPRMSEGGTVGSTILVRRRVREETFGCDDSVTVTSREAPESSRGARRTHCQPIGGGSSAEDCAGC